MAMLVLGRCFDSRIRCTQAGSIYRLKVHSEAADRKQRELLPQEVWINSRRNHRAEYHVAACAGKTVEVKSLHGRNCGNTSPALPVITSSQRSESGVRSGFTSQTNAPAALAISGMPAAG